MAVPASKAPSGPVIVKVPPAVPMAANLFTRLPCSTIHGLPLESMAKDPETPLTVGSAYAAPALVKTLALEAPEFATQTLPEAPGSIAIAIGELRPLPVTVASTAPVPAVSFKTLFAPLLVLATQM